MASDAPTEKRPRAKKPGAVGQPVRHALITGYPGFLSKRLLRELLVTAPRAKVTLLAEESQRAAAEADVRTLAAPAQRRIRIATGDVAKIDLGLAGLEIEALKDTTHIFHLAGIQRADAPKDLYERVNVDGTRNVIAMARELPDLERLVHFSTCLVSGTREGVITEDELDEGQGFRSAYEESKFRGERLVRAAMKELPCMVVRPSLVVGSSRTGEIDRFDGVYTMGILAVTSPVAVPLPLPGPGTAPLNLVPVDFLVTATLRLARDPRARGMTFHLVDPNPLSTRHVYDLIAQRAGKKVPKGALGQTFGSTLPSMIAQRFLRLPGIDRLSQKRFPALSLLDRFVVYNCSNALTLLDGTGIQCPRFDTYVDKLMTFVTDSLKRERTKRRVSAPDPYDA